MKKIIIFIVMLCLTILIIQPTVFAAEPYEFLPVDVIYYPNHMEIRKIYEMSASVDPATIPRANFERDNIKYKCTDILREVKIGNETKMHIEVETINSTKNDIESILKVLPLTKEILTEDGFYGTLNLNTSTLKSEIASYGSASSSVSVTRSYPNLYDMDSQHIPKSVTENNITYTLTDIQWKTENRYNEDDYEIGNRYTAVAIYSGTKTSSYVKSYKITAEFIGEVCRTGVSVIRYTVIFSGTKLEPSQTDSIPSTTESVSDLETESDTEPVFALETTTDIDFQPLIEQQNNKTSGFNWLFIVIPLALLAAASTACVIYMYLKNRKEKTNNEETIDYDYTDDNNIDNGDDSCDSSGL